MSCYPSGIVIASCMFLETNLAVICYYMNCLFVNLCAVYQQPQNRKCEHGPAVESVNTRSFLSIEQIMDIRCVKHKLI